MCGINGYISFTKKNLKKNILEMNTSIKHRGPDDEGYYVTQDKGNTLAFGNVRLSILDLTKRGHQPMGVEMKKNGKSNLIYKDKDLDRSDYIIVFNGEIYNFHAIKKDLKGLGWTFESTSDTEVLLKGYIQWNENILKKINGMFAFVIWDRSKDLLFGARDRFGKKPLKYYIDNHCFIFSSELKAIISQSVPRKIDAHAIDHYLTLQYVPSPKTGFEKILKLPHSHYFTFNLQTKELNIKRYWDIDYSNKMGLSYNKAKEELEKTIRNCIGKRLIADVEVGAFLSGGIDSSAVVAFASEHVKKLKTFTVAFKESAFDESKYAQEISKRYTTDHHEFLVRPKDLWNMLDKMIHHYDEPYADPSALPTLILSEKTSKYIKVALNGDGGDENFAGYDKYKFHILANLLKILPFQYIAKLSGLISRKFHSNAGHLGELFLRTINLSPSRRHLNYTSYFDEFKKESYYLKDFEKQLNQETYEIFTNITKSKSLKPLDAIFYLDFNTYVPEDLMVKTDIASMAFGLESRSPLLDYELVEFTAKLPYQYKIDLFNRKKIFKDLLKKYLPRKIIDRNKKGFSVPLNEWFRGELKDYIEKQLSAKDNLTNQIFKKGVIERLINEHTNGLNHGKKLWALLTLNKWGEKWL